MLDQRHSFTTCPTPNIAVQIESIWKVRCGESYFSQHSGGYHGGDESALLCVRTLSGRGVIGLDDGTMVMAEPDSITLAELSRMRMHSIAAKTWDFWWFEFHPADNRPIALPKNQPLAIPQSRREPENFEICFALLKECKETSSSLGSSIFSMVLQQWIYHWAGLAAPARPHEDEIDQVVKMMRENLAETLTIEQFAESISLCPRRFRQVFREIMGIGPKQFYDSLRLRAGANLLQMSNLSIGQIAERLGYSSQFHFSKAFRHRYHVPPSRYLRD